MSSHAVSLFYLVDPQSGGIVATNVRAGRETCQPLEQPNDLSPGLAEAIAKHSLSGVFPVVLEAPVAGPDGHFPAQIVLNRLHGREGELLLIEVSPLSLRAQTQGPLDAVTALPDRRALAEHRARWTTGAPAPHAVLFLDLDGFKRVNDQYGHSAGDQVLAEVASRWRHCVREDDLVVRYGGDEFVVLLGHVATRSDVEPIVKRLEDATRQAFLIGSSSMQISVTIGVAQAKDCEASMEALIAEADRDMYTAKIKRER